MKTLINFFKNIFCDIVIFIPAPKQIYFKINTLKDVQRYLNSIIFINSGGCGIAALAMFKWLKKNNLIEENTTNFVFLYKSDDGTDYLNNSSVLKQKSGIPVAPAHVILFHKGNYIDSEGIVEVNEYHWLQNVNEENFVVRANNNLFTWCGFFDRNNIKDIEKMLEIDMDDILILN